MAVQNSIIIVNHNRKDALSTLLANLAVGQAVTSEVIVVDSGSFDGSAELVQEDFPTIRLIQLEDNRGFSVAANRGFAQAIGSVVVFCHADIITEVHNLIELADRVREGEEHRVMAAVPRLVNRQGSELPLVGDLPSVANAMAQMLKPTASRGCAAPNLDHVADNEFALMPAVALNSELLQKLGGFDERFFLYYADADLCARLHEHSWRIAIQRKVSIVHDQAINGSDALPAPKARILRKDLLKYIEKHHSGMKSRLLGMQAKLMGKLSKDAI